MTKLICKVCKRIICEDIDRIKDTKWIQCSCGREPFLNPNYEGKDD